ncbi:tRNA modification GTPase TrmE [Afipia carboxidovorans OM5]|uniref:tRNA modification GTPase MnmE n=1 Tax=Afipia carboxidovorans (strain ATCC 49405 / DSM 1227 / KCTC 32145 / OM5) TaxID=504832 RepID=B6JAJ3_AFIC5|nr:tRNA uridine-5-carboxymethylaminomethyl(34) synthesis GTPase MnmE [Afipia carboxidovorans]ACI91518.1 tRNA modification GTPase TrmE [Afipia carboxidovorans OM5]AEI01316.1 tRNA modification GTPase [Afipia carboxidovorans OM4]AEI04890.1 tRNA modification GTPase [Afipia carboxidovorans OM5]
MPLQPPTIYALASGRPPAAIAIVRVSGPQVPQVLERLCGRLPQPRTATLVTLTSPGTGPIDQAVALWFPAPHSATGEDVAEFQLHGGRAVIAALFAALEKIDGLRPAEPGEFTRRAFENGKLDLTEAEGLDDLIHADTDRQRRQALRHLQGLLGHRAESWRAQIIEAMALIEAGIDFSDEGDVSTELMAPALARVASLRTEIEETLAASAQSERLREGLQVAIAGPPNAGKSTLLNRLARREAAIVSPHAGTTRDIIEVHLDLDGYPVTLIDTAGLRDASDPVEQEGVRRARARAEAADLVLWLDEAESNATPLAGEVPLWRVRNKIDLAGKVGASTGGSDPAFAISAVTGEGVDQLVAALVGFASDYFGGGEAALVSRARHRVLLTETVAALKRAEDRAGQGDEIVAEELRIAIHAVGRLLGRVDVEEILDSIFREFCIGK